MFSRIPQAIALAASSWRLLRQDKQLVLFPIMSGFCCLLVLAGFLAPFLINPKLLEAAPAHRPAPAPVRPGLPIIDPDQGEPRGPETNEEWEERVRELKRQKALAAAEGQAGAFEEEDDFFLRLPWWVFAAAFGWYFCNFFVITFFNAALIAYSVLRFNGEKVTVGDAIDIACRRLPQIAAWALVSASVGVILNLIESIHERVGEFVSAILGTAWALISFFVIPVLVVEKLGPFAAIQRSIHLLKRTWGETLGGRVTLGIVLFIALVPILIVGALGASLWSKGLAVVGIPLLVAAGIAFIVWMAVGPALNGIFLAAAYQFAAFKTVPDGFDGEALYEAFGTEK